MSTNTHTHTRARLHKNKNRHNYIIFDEVFFDEIGHVHKSNECIKSIVKYVYDVFQ